MITSFKHKNVSAGSSAAAVAVPVSCTLPLLFAGVISASAPVAANAEGEDTAPVSDGVANGKGKAGLDGERGAGVDKEEVGPECDPECGSVGFARLLYWLRGLSFGCTHVGNRVCVRHSGLREIGLIGRGPSAAIDEKKSPWSPEGKSSFSFSFSFAFCLSSHRSAVSFSAPFTTDACAGVGAGAAGNCFAR